MSDAPNGKTSRIHLDGSINFGHIVSVILTLTAIVAGWVTLDARVATLERDYRTQKVDIQAATVAAEVRLQGRITEIQARTADDIREIKTMMREGFRDLDVKLDRKMDKPVR